MVSLFDPLYNFMNITSHDDIIIQIAQTKVFQRLKGIVQAGITGLLTERKYSRYEHSIGVYLILKYLGNSTQQCIGGLIHDIYHTNFSHVTDEMFSKNRSFHEENKYQFMAECGRELVQILKEYDPEHSIEFYLNDENFVPAKNKDLGADMIDYFLRDAFYEHFLDKLEVKEIIEDLCMVGNRICVKHQHIADKFVKLSIQMTDDVYMSPKSKCMYILFSNILWKSMEYNIISRELLVYGFQTDEQIYQTIKRAQNPELKTAITFLESIQNCTYNKPDQPKGWKMFQDKIKRRLRYVKPPLCDNNTLVFHISEANLALIQQKIKEYEQEVTLFVK